MVDLSRFQRPIDRVLMINGTIYRGSTRDGIARIQTSLRTGLAVAEGSSGRILRAAWDAYAACGTTACLRDVVPTVLSANYRGEDPRRFGLHAVFALADSGAPLGAIQSSLWDLVLACEQTFGDTDPGAFCAAVFADGLSDPASLRPYLGRFHPDWTGPRQLASPRLLLPVATNDRWIVW